MEISEILSRHGFSFKKGLGQNFITDTGLLAAVVRDAGVRKEDCVVEIGTGAGTLTRVISANASEVKSFDVDESLKPVLAETLAGLRNVEMFFKDVLRTDDSEIERITGGKPFKVVANIPYYITTPLIMRFLESGLKVTSMTLMVQEEVAARLNALPGSADYGAITVAVNLRGDVRVTRKVPRGVFRPVPKVDSAVVRIDVYEKYPAPDVKAASLLARAAFRMRRKTLVNNIGALSGYNKEQAAEALEKMGLDLRIRGETLSAEEFVRLAKILSEPKG